MFVIITQKIVKVEQNSLNLRGCSFTDLPNVLLHMSPLLFVDLSSNGILRLGEEVVKRWCSYPNIVKNKRFLNIQCDLENLEEPPFAIFEQGPEACYEYYCSMKLTSKQNCRFVNVQALGQKGSGKTSLVQTMKNEKPSLEDSSESISDSVGTVKLMADDALVQIYDYAADAIYDLAFHMFVKSTTQIVVLAVNLPEYSKEKHDIAVTRWLSSIFTTSIDCTVIVAGTQADLCTDEEIKRKKTLIESEITSWVEAEHQFIMCLPDASRNLAVNAKRVARTKFIITSSTKINGVKELLKCLFERAKEKKVVLPKHWRNMYRSFYKISDEGKVIPVPVPNAQSEITQFFTLSEANVTFMKSLSRLTIWISFYIRKDFYQCLRFFNNIVMLLWYEDDKQLQDVVFTTSPSLLMHYSICSSVTSKQSCHLIQGLLDNEKLTLMLMWQPLLKPGFSQITSCR